MKKLLAHYSTDHQQLIFGKIAELLSPVLTLEMVSDCPADLSPYAGQLTLSEEGISGLASYQLPTDWDLTNLSQDQLVKLTWDMSQFLAQLDQPALDLLPLQVTVTDQTNQVTYHNGRPKDPFLPLDIEAEPVPDWVIEEVTNRADHAVHLLLPSISFEQILIQSYQGLYDQGQFKGIFQQVQDIKPMLASYLKETGQALVGWSDTVSGASIKNDAFDEEDF